MKTTIAQETQSKWVGAGLLAAITASLCCITPVLALLSGASGMAPMVPIPVHPCKLVE